eukprot:scaffold10597_cov124-Isochrysis_galbana.AAC.2
MLHAAYKLRQGLHCLICPMSRSYGCSSAGTTRQARVVWAQVVQAVYRKCLSEAAVTARHGYPWR